jgi:hypothetical protein
MPPLAMKLIFLNSEFGKLRFLESESRQPGAPIYLGALDLGMPRDRGLRIFLLLTT